MSGSEVRGRVMLNFVSREFDTDSSSGAIMTALELYNLPPPQDNVAAFCLEAMEGSGPVCHEPNWPQRFS